MVIATSKVTFRLLVAALVFGVLYRLSPVLSDPSVLTQFFVTEDGYLMLTVARNVAIGLGMSVSDGTIISNGVQPLATFLFSLPYHLTQGDKLVGLVGVHIILAAIAVAGVFSVRDLARTILGPQNNAALWPWMVAALWFVSPVLLLHTMNGLETGLYMLMATLNLLLFGRILTKAQTVTLMDRLAFGVLCGVTFLTRNDAVFLIAGMFLTWLIYDMRVLRAGFIQTVVKLILPGLLSIAVAAPWLINNYALFGSIVPISGIAEAQSGGFAVNAAALPVKLFEYFFPMLPVPSGLEESPAVIIAAALLVALISLTFAIGVWRRGGVAAYIVTAYGIFALAICAYYGFYFGAGWFLSRYLSPVAPLLIIASVSVLLDLVHRAYPHGAALASAWLGLAGVAISVSLLGWFAVSDAGEQGHFQVVDWVDQNIPDTTWVGAVQSGTLGYWHDRTINLDGKVNPHALRALLDDGHFFDYLVNSQIEYLADWSGIAGWTSDGRPEHVLFSEIFETVVQDKTLNLGVMRRR
ncbi:MAG: hypothetical protein V3V25_13185 [Paracoccaceae bacterium]